MGWNPFVASFQGKTKKEAVILPPSIFEKYPCAQLPVLRISANLIRPNGFSVFTACGEAVPTRVWRRGIKKKNAPSGIQGQRQACQIAQHESLFCGFPGMKPQENTLCWRFPDFKPHVNMTKVAKQNVWSSFQHSPLRTASLCSFASQPFRHQTAIHK